MFSRLSSDNPIANGLARISALPDGPRALVCVGIGVIVVAAWFGVRAVSATALHRPAPTTVAVFRRDGTFRLATVQGPLRGTYVTGAGDTVVLTSRLRYHIGNHGGSLMLRDARTGELVMTADGRQ